MLTKTLAEKRERLAFYRGEIMHEWTLLTTRVGTLITSQSFLVTAYTISLGNTNPKWGERFMLYFPLLLVATGLLVTLLVPGDHGSRAGNRTVAPQTRAVISS